jgi:hypothetical protein
MARLPPRAGGGLNVSKMWRALDATETIRSSCVD